MFTKDQLKYVSVERPKDEERFNELMNEVPLRVIDAIPELNYYTNPNPTPSDHISFLQSIINSSRIVLKSSRLLKIAEALFKQGFLFRHQKKAIEAKATKYSRAEEKAMKECISCGKEDHICSDY